MHPPSVNPLYQQWLSLAVTHADTLAVREVATGREWSFAALLDLAAAAPASPPLLHATPRGLGLIVDVLRAWRDGVVLLADDGSGVPPPPLECLKPGICHLKITSGSTGTPRHVQFRPSQLAADAAQIVATMGLRPAWPNLGVISMAHSYGFSNLVLPLLLHGIPLWILDSPLPETLRRVLDSIHPVTLAAVPAMWQAWDRVGLDFSNIRLAISAGAPLPCALESAVFQRTGLKIHNFYGSSECGGIAYDSTDTPRTEPSLAGLPMAGVALTCDPATGCLRITSAAVADGYVASAPADAATEPGDGTWLAPDVVRFDENGAVHLLGRAGEFISVAGHKISPAVIEEMLLRLPGVRCCVVFGVPSTNPIRVEDLVAVVNLADGTDLNSLKSAFDGRPSTFLPRSWWQCADLQPDARGKLSRHHWRDRWLALQSTPCRPPNATA